MYYFNLICLVKFITLSQLEQGNRQKVNISSVEQLISVLVCILGITLYCQAQPKRQVKLRLKAELALFPLDPATPPPTHPVKV